MDLIQKGSEIAKSGFNNEKDVCNKFNNWLIDLEAQKWLTIMCYDLKNIESVQAVILHSVKTDISVQIKIKLRSNINTENIQVKLVSNKKGFNQVDKRWLSDYKFMWNIPDDVYRLLQYYTGEIKPYKNRIRDSRRMFLDEFSENEKNIILNWFSKNKKLILTDIIKGSGKFSVKWVLVVQKIETSSRWVLVNIKEVLKYYSKAKVKISSRGSLYLGKITVQRKGGDNGRRTASMLQFKLDPTELFDIVNN